MDIWVSFCLLKPQKALGWDSPSHQNRQRPALNLTSMIQDQQDVEGNTNDDHSVQTAHDQKIGRIIKWEFLQKIRARLSRRGTCAQGPHIQGWRQRMLPVLNHVVSAKPKQSENDEGQLDQGQGFRKYLFGSSEGPHANDDDHRRNSKGIDVVQGERGSNYLGWIHVSLSVSEKQNLKMSRRGSSIDVQLHAMPTISTWCIFFVPYFPRLL